MIAEIQSLREKKMPPSRCRKQARRYERRWGRRRQRAGLTWRGHERQRALPNDYSDLRGLPLKD